jgi:hypothetical protein
MKVLTILFAATSLGLTGCESDMPPEPNRTNPVQRGLSGEGRLTQPDRSDDPVIRETTRTGY